jgi:hypothetical protein
VLTVSGQFGGRSFLGQTRLSKASAVVELEVELFEEDHGACGDYRRESATLRLRRTATGEARILRAELTVEATSDRCHLDGWKESVVLTPANDELCRQSLTDHLGFNVYTLDPETREPVVGFSGVQGYGVWGQDLNASLVMRTATAKFYYTLPCDICADLLRCDLENGEIRSLFSGHSASCGDLPEAERKVATYLNCN